MLRAVHLEDVRCDGAAHAGCQAACLIFWKDAWLKPADGAGGKARGEANQAGACTEADVWAATRPAPPHPEPIYACQSTRVPAATQPLRWWDLRHTPKTARRETSGRATSSTRWPGWSPQKIATAGIGVGSGVRWVYNAVQRLQGGTPYPWGIGQIQTGSRTPSRKLDLQPGELVKVRSHADILQTLDEAGNNRGMCWDPEMVPYCGGTYRVQRRITLIIDEKTGRLLPMKNDCIQLEGSSAARATPSTAGSVRARFLPTGGRSGSSASARAARRARHDIEERTVNLWAGIASGRRNACVALCTHDQVLGICEQERITRVPGAGVNSTGLPDEALDELLTRAGLARRDLAGFALAEHGAGPARPDTLRIDHHFAHACAAFLPSRFDAARIVICDHEAPHVSVWDGRGTSVTRVDWPWHGTGFAELYSQCAEVLGFVGAGGEQRMEALARLDPSARDERIEQLFALAEDRLVIAPDWRGVSRA